MHHTQNMPQYLMSWNDWSTTWETKWISLSLPMCTQLFARLKRFVFYFNSSMKENDALLLKKLKIVGKDITHFEQKLKLCDNLYLMIGSFSDSRYAIFHFFGLGIYMSTSCHITLFNVVVLFNLFSLVVKKKKYRLQVYCSYLITTCLVGNII